MYNDKEQLEIITVFCCRSQTVPKQTNKQSNTHSSPSSSVPSVITLTGAMLSVLPSKFPKHMDNFSSNPLTTSSMDLKAPLSPEEKLLPLRGSPPSFLSSSTSGGGGGGEEGGGGGSCVAASLAATVPLCGSRSCTFKSGTNGKTSTKWATGAAMSRARAKSSGGRVTETWDRQAAGSASSL